MRRRSSGAPSSRPISAPCRRTGILILYQDVGPGAYQVYATTIGGRDYAFSAADRGNSDGVHVYDMTRALENFGGGAGCVEDSRQGGTACGGVYLGRIGGSQAVSYVDGFQTTAGRHVLAFSSAALGPRGVALWDVSNPAAPLNLVPGGGRLFAAELVFGIAVWEQEGGQYLVLRTPSGSRIHDLTACLASGACASPPLVWSAPLPGVGRQLVTYSNSGGIGYLYLGDENGCAAGLQREWLYDLSRLTTTGPVEITPPWTMSVDSIAEGVIDVGYWGWYYPGNAGSDPLSSLDFGYSKVSPRTGKFHDGYFYRVAWTVFDVHRKGPLELTLFNDGFESGDTSIWSSSEP